MGYEIEEFWGSTEGVPAQSCDKSITSNNPASLKFVVNLARSESQWVSTVLSLRVLRYLKKLGIAYGVHQTRKEDYADVLTSSTRSWPLHLREHDVLHHDPANPP